MITRGTVFHHKNLVFHNGFTGKKYLVLLNSPDRNEAFIFVKTTSQKKNKPTTPGCLKIHSLYFIPAKTTFFPLDTWVQLYERYLFSPKDIRTNPDIKPVGSLDATTIDRIVDCLFRHEEKNIPPDQNKLLRPPIQKSLNLLLNKYKKKH